MLLHGRIDSMHKRLQCTARIAVLILLVQGGITLLAGQLVFLSEPAVLDAINATGGLLILGIGINLLDLGRIHIGNLLPALLYAIVGALLFP